MVHWFLGHRGHRHNETFWDKFLYVTIEIESPIPVLMTGRFTELRGTEKEYRAIMLLIIYNS